MNIFKRIAVTYVTIAVVDKIIRDSREIAKTIPKIMDERCPEWRQWWQEDVLGKPYEKKTNQITNKIGF